jgi:hypothetical protein
MRYEAATGVEKQIGGLLRLVASWSSRGAGIDVQELSAKQVGDLFPLARTDDILAGSSPRSASCCNYSLTQCALITSGKGVATSLHRRGGLLHEATYPVVVESQNLTPDAIDSLSTQATRPTG